MEYQSDLLKNILDIPTETQTVKFKRLLGDKVVTKVIETIVAMSNTDGGLIILGVDDPEKTKAKGSDRIYGIDENVEVFDAISKEVQRIVPPISGIWPPGFIDVDEKKKRISLVSVPKAIDSFHSINNHVFVRGEKGNRQLTAHEVIKFAYAKGFEKADKSLVNVDFDLLKTLYFEGWKEARRINDSPIETILEKTGLARKNDEGKLLPTLAAVLLFAEYPNDLTETKCAVRVLQYTGTIENIAETPNLIGIPKTIQGQLIKQINEAHEYVLTLLRAGIRIPSGFKTIYQIPERVLF